MSNISERIFKSKYALNDKETFESASWRVSKYVAQAEALYGATDEQIFKIAGEFHKYISNKIFVPSGRILANSDTETKNLSNCFYLNIEDSRDSIYSTLQDSANIFAWGGGLGIGVSDIREKGALINSTGGKATGPVSFLQLFNLTGEVIEQASRRAAIIAIMNISHPDIQEFIHHKSTPNSFTQQFLEEYSANLGKFSEAPVNEGILKKTLIDKQLSHFNISVEITDKFMDAVINDEYWDLISPSTKEVVNKVKAKNLLYEIAQQIWLNGDPGVIFKDRLEEDNMVGYLNKNLGVNPCAEVVLLDGESCVLGSINLLKIFEANNSHLDINLELLEYAVRIAVRFLDNIHDISFSNVDKITKTSHNLRRIGLGVMGFADLLAELELPYNSDEAKNLANYLSWFISYFAWMESFSLAEEKGEFYYYNKDLINSNVIDKVVNSKYSPAEFNFSKIPVRNVSVTALAPTGSISLLSGINSSIEPFYALAYKKNITEGISNKALSSYIIINPILEKKLKKYNYSDENIEEISKYVFTNGTLVGCDLVDDKIKSIFLTAHDIKINEHIDMQASWQEYITNSISKTCNAPNNFTVEDIYDSLIYLWKSKVKSSTIYRDGSRLFQINNTGIS